METAICQACFQEFSSFDPAKRCPCCAGPKADTHSLCLECLKWQKTHADWLTPHLALFAYNEKMKAYFHEFKFRGDRRLASCFSQVLYETLRPLHKDFYFVPIPVSTERKQERGFNQVEELLQAAELPMELCLEKIAGIGSDPQSTKNRSARLQSTNPFRLKSEYQKEDLEFKKNILLIDDLYTTGATLMHAKKCFPKGYVNGMRTFTLVRS